MLLKRSRRRNLVKDFVVSQQVQSGACSSSRTTDNRPFAAQDMNGDKLVAYVANYTGATSMAGVDSGLMLARAKRGQGARWTRELIPTSEPTNAGVQILLPSVAVTSDGTLFVLYFIADRTTVGGVFVPINRVEVAIKSPGSTWKTFRAMEERVFPNLVWMTYSLSRVVAIPK